MTPEERRLLENTAALAEENNAILRKMQSRARWGRVMKGVYWIIILAVSFGAYIAVKPYMEQLKKLYGDIGSNLNQIEAIKQGFGNLKK